MRRHPIVATLLLAVVVCACGGDSKPTLTVSAATSLKSAFTAYGSAFPDAEVRSSFAGSDQLAAQIRQGVKPDIFASANTTLPDDLYKHGLVEKPVVFAANRLVLAVPASGAKVSRLSDLTKPGTTIAMGSATVPVGAYTRKVLAKLPAGQRQAIVANVRSNEPDVGGVVGKISQGAVDAGFVYVTDVRAADGKLRALRLPDALQPQVSYGVAVVKGSKHHEQAQKFVDGLLNGEGRKRLVAAGFLPPPGT
jgi:molybdate transport system substrate-binding protein